ncbi:MAG: hypothetical protein H6657_08320 [Ardenticatenaceae bacterium]|nr:hypothetical protein [Ardenticatenaceae bacterium]
MGNKWFAWFWAGLWLWTTVACSQFPQTTARLPTPTVTDSRQSAEQLILDATVRVAVETWLVNDGERGYTILKSEGHGTVVNGRYLITHNHHTIPLSLSETGFDPDIYTRLLVFNVAGDLVNILPLTDFQIALREPQTLLLAYVGEDTDSPFGTVGLKVEQVQVGTAVLLEPDAEVAQINWDGQTTQVEWTQVTAVYPQHEPPCVELASQPQLGSSGGGIFWQGQHIGNTWLKGIRTGAANGGTCQYSKAALNSPELLAYFVNHALP